MSLEERNWRVLRDSHPQARDTLARDTGDASPATHGTPRVQVRDTPSGHPTRSRE